MKIIDETADDTAKLLPFAMHNAVAKPHEFPHMVYKLEFSSSNS